MKGGAAIKMEVQAKMFLAHSAEMQRLIDENDYLRSFIIDAYNASPAERLNIIFDAREFIKQLNTK